MKIFYIVLLITGVTFAQAPATQTGTAATATKAVTAAKAAPAAAAKSAATAAKLQ